MMTGNRREGDPLPVLAALFAEADDPVVVTGGVARGADGPPIVLANPAMARLVGEATADLIGRGCLTLLDAITDPTTVERVTAALESDTALRAEVWTRRERGAPCPSRWELLPLRDAEGAVTHRVIVLHDLTARRLAEQAHADLAAAARRAGHDLNNTITGLIVNLSLLNGSTLNEAQRRSCVSDALDATREGARVTRSLLDALHRLGGAAARDDDGSTDRAGANPGWTESADNREERARAPESSAPRARLLLLDDDEKLLRMMAGFLEHAGFEVTATAEPAECVARFRERLASGGHFDLVILDLTIDDGHADQTTLAALRAIDPDVRAVAHSGHPYADAMTAPRAHGFLAAIQKPTPLSALAARIDALLRSAL